MSSNTPLTFSPPFFILNTGKYSDGTEVPPTFVGLGPEDSEGRAPVIKATGGVKKVKFAMEGDNPFRVFQAPEGEVSIPERRYFIQKRGSVYLNIAGGEGTEFFKSTPGILPGSGFMITENQSNHNLWFSTLDSQLLCSDKIPEIPEAPFWDFEFEFAEKATPNPASTISTWVMPPPPKREERTNKHLQSGKYVIKNARHGVLGTGDADPSHEHSHSRSLPVIRGSDPINWDIQRVGKGLIYTIEVAGAHPAAPKTPKVVDGRLCIPHPKPDEWLIHPLQVPGTYMILRVSGGGGPIHWSMKNSEESSVYVDYENGECDDDCDGCFWEIAPVEG